MAPHVALQQLDGSGAIHGVEQVVKFDAGVPPRSVRLEVLERFGLVDQQQVDAASHGGLHFVYEPLYPPLALDSRPGARVEVQQHVAARCDVFD